MSDTQWHQLNNGETVSISRNGNHQNWIGDNGPRMRSVTTMAKHVDGDLFGAGTGWALKQVRLNNGDLGAPARSNTEAKQVGDRLHKAIDRYIQDGVVAEDNPLFLAWFHAVGKGEKWVESERFIYHPELLYGGTVDALSQDSDGSITVWDWKTRERESYQNNGGYLHEYAQLAAYTDALRAMGSVWAPSRGYIVYVMRDAIGNPLPDDEDDVESYRREIIRNEVDVVEVDLSYGSKLFRASRELFLLTTGGK